MGVKWNHPDATFGKVENRGAEPARTESKDYHCCAKCRQPFVRMRADIAKNVVVCPSCQDMATLHERVEPENVAVFKVPKPKLSANDRIKMRDEEINYNHYMAKHATTPKARKAHKARFEKLTKDLPGWEPPDMIEPQLLDKTPGPETVIGEPAGGKIYVMESHGRNRTM